MSPRGRSGFTLLELLLASTLTTLVLAGVMLIIGVVARDARVVTGGAEGAERDWSNAVLGVIERDLARARGVRIGGGELTILGSGGGGPLAGSANANAPVIIRYHLRVARGRSLFLRTTLDPAKLTTENTHSELILSGVETLRFASSGEDGDRHREALRRAAGLGTRTPPLFELTVKDFVPVPRTLSLSLALEGGEERTHALTIH